MSNLGDGASFQFLFTSFRFIDSSSQCTLLVYVFFVYEETKDV